MPVRVGQRRYLYGALALLCVECQAVAEQTGPAPKLSGEPRAPYTPTFNLRPQFAGRPRTGPTTWCRQPDVLREIMSSLSETNAVKSANERVIDFVSATTEIIDLDRQMFACHGIAHLTNGQLLPGTFSVHKNGAGDSIWTWMNDSAPRVAEPEPIDGMMTGRDENACPSWSNTPEARKILVHLAGVIKVYTDAVEELKTTTERLLNDPATDPSAVAGLSRLIHEDETHLQAVAACRDDIERKL